VVAVAGHPGPALDHADIVLPVAVAHERPGTTTNIEGRVTRLAQKLVPPGLAWPDWTIAVALCDELGYDLAIGSVAEIAEEIERVAPAYLGFAPEPAGEGAPEPLRRLAPTGVTVPPPDHYSLRLVSTRRLYDRGTAVVGSPSLEPLVSPARAIANPSEFARLGVESGERVRISSAQGKVVLEAAADDGVPKGVLVVEFNLPEPGGAANAAGALIDATAVVNDVRLETL
jgi:predicted molibdopterin-dependent oxidoreductase YjgC